MSCRVKESGSSESSRKLRLPELDHLFHLEFKELDSQLWVTIVWARKSRIRLCLQKNLIGWEKRGYCFQLISFKTFLLFPIISLFVFPCVIPLSTKSDYYQNGPSLLNNFHQLIVRFILIIGEGWV